MCVMWHIGVFEWPQEALAMIWTQSKNLIMLMCAATAKRQQMAGDNKNEEHKIACLRGKYKAEN